MAKIDEIKFEPGGTGKFISDKFLFVPPYQRSYAWGDKQVSELFQDIASTINTGEYFIGSIVISKDENENSFEIIDGQQRIATIVILFSAMRNYYHEKEEKEYSEDIEKKFLRSFDRNQKCFLPKIKLNNIDNDFFQKLVINRKDENKEQIKPLRESHNRIQKAFDLATSHIINLTKPFGGKTDVLIDWTNFIENNLKVINVTVPDISDAYTIFETLNDRGKSLATTDLIKNYLFKVSKASVNEAQDIWTRMVAVIEAAKDEEEVEIFIKYYWSSIYGFTRIKDRNLFVKIREKVKSPHDSISHLNNFIVNSERYVALLNPNHPFWSPHPSTCKDYIGILNSLKLQQYFPLMLSILDKFEKDEVKKSLKLLIDWFVRNLITGKLGGGTIEELYSEMAVQVNDKTIKNANQLRTTLLKNTPSDQLFKEQFQIATVSQSFLARYYLSALENQKRGKGEPELVPNANVDVVNLEHILPQKPDDLGKDWPEFKGEHFQSNLKKIGNLCLMKSKLNSKISNGKFIIKKENHAIKKSDFILTKEIKGYDNWTPVTILDRQKKLAELALKTWNLKV